MKPCKVWLCVDRFDAKDGYVWAIRAGNRWFTAKHVKQQIPMETVFRGRHARQPKAYLRGYGVVTDDGCGTLTIAASQPDFDRAVGDFGQRG
jgi:hypothetical protein